MNQLRSKMNVGRMFAGLLLGALLAFVSPLATLTEIFASLPLILLPAIGLTLIHGWAGKWAAAASGLMIMLVFGWTAGNVYMWVVYLLAINPVILLARIQDKPFFSQMKSAITAFGLGLLGSVVVLYSAYGSGFVAQQMERLVELVHSAPAAVIEGAIASLPDKSGMPVDASGFIAQFELVIDRLTGSYQYAMPGRIFGGVLLSAVLCVTALNRMRAFAGASKPGSYVPPCRWYLPASTSYGLLLMLVASYGLELAGIRGGTAVFYAAFEIVVWAFSIQAFASMSRRVNTDGRKPGRRYFVLGLLIAVALSGGGPYIALYGCASAMFGSRGALQQRIAEKKNRNRDED